LTKARELGIDFLQLAESEINRFTQDMEALNTRPAALEPRATESIAGMIELIRGLESGGHTYTVDGVTYFDVTTFVSFGELSHLTNEEMTALAAERGGSPDDPRQRNALDFVLWQPSADDEPRWDSPFGAGRPGWHIECSAMSTEYLGNHFDIHCGGVDNLFPHHENEIAQTVCATGELFVNIWMHCEYLTVERGKMSKSEGNNFSISDLVEKDFSGETLRYILLNTHYRSKLNFTMDKKHEAVQVVQRITDLFDRLLSINKTVENDGSLPEEYSQFEGALDNDLDTPGALAIFFEWVRKTNIKLDSGSLREKEAVTGLNFLDKVNSIFDLIQEKIEIPKEILALVNVRQKARQNNDWVLSDKLRDKIYDLGWNVEDTLTGQKCKPLKS
jgi:cysteinyl-tRNA synthetase